MFDVVNGQGGTARASRILTEGCRWPARPAPPRSAASRPEERARGVTSNADLPWERRDHALWVNFAPYDNPRYAVSVVVEHGGGGSAAAAPHRPDITMSRSGAASPIEAYPRTSARSAASDGAASAHHGGRRARPEGPEASR
jgi:penicillin-binding protein 2